MGWGGNRAVGDLSLARLTYVATTRHWVFEVSAEGDRFRKYARLPSGALEDLLGEIDADPTFVFW